VARLGSIHFWKEIVLYDQVSFDISNKKIIFFWRESL